MSLFTKRAQLAKIMIGEASSPFSIPAAEQYIKKNIYIQIGTKYIIRFKSYDHFHLKSLTNHMMLSEASSLFWIQVAGQC